MCLAALVLAYTSHAVTVYVDWTATNGLNNGSSWTDAYTDLDTAVNSANTGDLVLVNPGTYGKISRTDGVEFEVRSVAGSETTIIDANHADKCISLWYDTDGTQSNIVFSGFTLQNGTAGIHGGKLCNSIIRYCQANYHVLSYQSDMYNVLAYCNTSTIERLQRSIHCNVQNCTFVSNSCPSPIYSFSYGTYCNNIVRDNIGTNSTSSLNIYLGGTMYNNYVEQMASTPDANGNFGTVDPMFSDISVKDYALSSRSPLVNAGNNTYVSTEYDLSGNDRVLFGVVDIGAYEWYPVSRMVIPCLIAPMGRIGCGN